MITSVSAIRFAYKCILVLFLYVFAVCASIAQDSSCIVHLKHPDLRQLEWFTYKSVNDLRIEKKLPELVWDDVLYRAAKDHADYLIKEKKLSHFQTIKGKRTPAERVKIHGGLIYTIVGENIAAVPLGVQILIKGRKRSTVTYQAAGYTIAQGWKFSPGHYKNIISPKYNCTALATSYDSLNQRVIAVQVFAYTSTSGTKNNLPDYSKYLLQLPEKKLPFGLKGYRYKAKNQKAVNGFLKMSLDRGHLFGSFKAAKKIFKGRKSGLSQEFIPLRQYDSTSKEFVLTPNRRNGLYELNGELTAPVYRRALLKYSRKYSVREYYINTRYLRIKKPPKYFVYPMESAGEEEEFNVFLIKSKRLEVFMSYVKIPAKFFPYDFPKLDLVNSFKLAKTERKFRLYHKYDTLQFKIFYSPNEVTILPEKQEEIKKAFHSKPGKITLVNAAAFASIEGDKISNAKLAKDRMAQLMVLIKPYLDSMLVPPTVKTREQWELFYKQITGTRLQHLKKMKADEIRLYINQNKTDTLVRELLDSQRYMIVKVIWREDLKEYLPTKSVTEIYDSLKSIIDNSEKPKPEHIRALEKAQLNLYYEISQADSLQRYCPEVPHLERYPVFRYHDVLFQYIVLKNISDKEFYDKLHQLGRSKYFPGNYKSQLLYNNLVLIYSSFIKEELPTLLDIGNISCKKYRHKEFHLRKFKKIKCSKRVPQNFIPDTYYVLKEIPVLINRVKGEKIDNVVVDDLWRYYYLHSIYSLYFFIPIHPEIYRLLPGIKKYFHPNDAVLTDEERLKLAYFYCAFKKYVIAKNLIKPMVTRPEPHKEALKLYLCLVFEDYKDEHEFVDLLISEYSRLGKEEWCDLWTNPRYLNFLLLEDLKLKNFYNCNCGR